ncbi:MAG: efflux RND transporter periplasmic adaptor subunit [Myxococcales bacterium]|nr:efflux RND transporter periplasmic adaptor subunit [Myxococcales bacterium]MDH3486022.1 efflux RND transporter periplasmic adaptor subunit [Myxococcales bacterium]
MEGSQTPVDEKLEIPRLDSSRGRVIAIVAGVLVVGGAVATYFLTRGPEESPYRVAQVLRTSIVKEIRVTGHLELTDQVEVPAPIEGQLVKVMVQPGDSVEQGQLLAQLDKGLAEVAFHVAQAELQVARARVSETEAAAQRATESLERTKRLAEKNLASDSALEAARSEMIKANAVVQAARAERGASLSRASLRSRERDRTDIVAPRAGLVLEVPPHTGMIVGPRNRLFRIGAPVDQMNVAAPIGEADIGEVTVGLGAKFEVPTYPGRVFEATVKHISPDPQTEYGAIFYRVKLATENPERLLLPGMTAQVRINVAQVEDVLAVREAALRFTPDGASAAPPRSRVWRIRGEVLEEMPVEVGLSDGAITEVRPTEPDSLDVDDPIAIGLALDGPGNGPLLSLKGRR